MRTPHWLTFSARSLLVDAIGFCLVSSILSLRPFMCILFPIPITMVAIASAWWCTVHNGRLPIIVAMIAIKYGHPSGSAAFRRLTGRWHRFVLRAGRGGGTL
jgi:hypothetical protein